MCASRVRACVRACMPACLPACVRCAWVEPVSKRLEHILHGPACSFHAAQIFVIVHQHFDKEQLHSKIRVLESQGFQKFLHPRRHVSVGRAQLLLLNHKQGFDHRAHGLVAIKIMLYQ